MENVINVTTTEKEIVIREGVALTLKEPESIKFSGVLHAPGNYLEKRKDLLTNTSCHLIANYNEGFLIFVTDEKNPYRDHVGGKLKRSAVLESFSINGNKFYGDKELAKFLKSQAFYFVDEGSLKKLILSLMNFSATITTIIEKNSDARGNVKNLLEKKVSSDIAEFITVKMPIFDGYPSLEFPIYIGAEATDSGVKFFLESPELLKLEMEQKKALMDAEIKKFKDFGCAILEQ